jgi:hypothetical protein
MTTYTLNLSPALVNLASEGGLDTSLYNGNSLQRTAYIEVHNGSDRKIVEVRDGGSFNDTMQTLTTLSNAGHSFIV